MFIFNELSDCLENNYKKIYLPCRELPLYLEKLSIKTKIRISTLYTGKNITQSTPPLLPYAVLFLVTISRRKKEKKAQGRSAVKLWCHSQQSVRRSKHSTAAGKEWRKWGWARTRLLSHTQSVGAPDMLTAFGEKGAWGRSSHSPAPERREPGRDWYQEKRNALKWHKGRFELN